MKISNISIITVVFNGASTLEDTIKSIIKYKSFGVEYIVIDGGSRDGSMDIITNYRAFIDILISEPDHGIYDAMNKGWQLAKKENYILFLGADDLLVSLPNISLLNQKIYYGDVWNEKHQKHGTANDWRLKLGNTIHHQSLLIKKEIHIEPPFNIKYKTYADFDFNQRLYKSGYVFNYCSELRATACSTGLSKHFKLKESLKIVYKNFGLYYIFLAIIYYSVLKIKSTAYVR